MDGLSHIPRRWMEELIVHRGEVLPLPKWDTLFIPKDSSDARNIDRLLRALSSGEPEKPLADAGWNLAGDTGVLAIEYDGELLLGIDDAGYDFYNEHWVKLYDALGYHWH